MQETVATSTGRGEAIGAVGLGQAHWAVLDQALIAGTNFITTILLGRQLSKEAFGSFTLVYSLLLFANSVQVGLITTPHNVLGVTRTGREYASYTASTAVGQLLLAIVASALALAGWGMMRMTHFALAPLLLALVPAIIAMQLQEFVRRVLYTEGRVFNAFIVDLIGYGGQAAAVAALWYLHRLDGAAALHAMAGAYAIGGLVGFCLVRRSMTGRIVPGVLVENWHFGKWVVGGEIVGYWLSVYMLTVYLPYIIIGGAATGILRAIHTVFGPSRILADVFCNMLPIRFARTVAEGGRKALHTQVIGAYLLAIPLLGGYCLLVAIFARPVLWLLFHNVYVDSGPVLSLYAIAAFISYMTWIVASALRANRQTRRVFTGQLWASLIALPIGCVMIRFFGMNGAVLGMIVTYIATMLMFWASYRDETGETDNASGGADISNASAEENGLPLEAAGVGPQGPGAILERIFELLDRNAVPYCVLHGYERFPHVVPSDVDCIMPAEVLPHRLAELLHDNRVAIGAEIVQWVHEDTHYFVLAGRNADGSVCFLHLDVVGDYELRNRQFYRGAEVIGSRRRYRDFWTPSPQIEFGCYLVRRITKGQLGENQARRLSELYSEDPEGCRLQIGRFWGRRSAQALAMAAANFDWEPVRQRLRRYRGELLRRMTLRQPAGVFRRAALRILRRVGRWVRPRHGFHLILLGPDGAGKSSVARAVRQDLAPAFFDTTGRSFPPALLHRDGGMSDVAPHGVRPRSWLTSTIRAVAYWFVYYRVGHYFTVHVELARFTLVVHDRHLMDALVDPKRYRYSGPRWLLRLICRLVPRSDLLLALDAPADVLQARKQEVAPEETARQCAEYRRLIATIPKARLIDAARPLGRVIAEVDEAILRSLAIRTAHRLGLAAEECVNPAVVRAVRELSTAEEDGDWVIERLGEGEQADVFTARMRDGSPIWREHDQVVVKLYRTNVPEYMTAIREEYESLQSLAQVLDGRDILGVHIASPLPLLKSGQVPAIVMTRVSGISLSKLIGTGAAGEQLSASLVQVVVTALERYWSASARIYGDLDLNNILYDPSTRTLALIDPGMPESAYVCPECPDTFFPASRDLAYMLFDVAASLTSHLANPGARHRQTQFVETVIERFASGIGSPERRKELLSELDSCAKVHLNRIRVAWSPMGVCRWLVRHTAAVSIAEVLARLGGEGQRVDEMAC